MKEYRQGTDDPSSGNFKSVIELQQEYLPLTFSFIFMWMGEGFDFLHLSCERGLLNNSFL